ncbi:MAG: hypothetical protein U0871_20140 [Gemmataceae bacterium]
MAATPKRRPGGVVNWNPPPAKDAVERAVEDGMKDPAAIAKWAKDEFGLALTPEEVVKLWPGQPPEPAKP